MSKVMQAIASLPGFRVVALGYYTSEPCPGPSGLLAAAMREQGNRTADGKDFSDLSSVVYESAELVADVVDWLVPVLSISETMNE